MEELLKRLKIDIGILNSDIYDERLMSLMKSSLGSINEFVGAGHELDISNDDDAELLIDYSRWMWLTRKEPTKMPDNIKFRMNCKAFGRKLGGSL